jgi:aminocarboxymuconate-semialdehyde decarboxylase
MLLPRLVHAWNVLPKAKEALDESPATYARRFFYDALVFDPAAIRFLVERYGSSQIVVGSDYPFNMGDPDPVGTLDRAGLDADAMTAILSTNARRFLRL